MAKFEVYQDKQAEWRWRLVANNGRIMADSAEGYTQESDARKALDRFKELAQQAEIVRVGEGED